jgi:hypothetical protein
MNGLLGNYNLIDGLTQSVAQCTTDNYASATINLCNRSALEACYVDIAVTTVESNIDNTSRYITFNTTVSPKTSLEIKGAVISANEYLTVVYRGVDSRCLSATTWAVQSGSAVAVDDIVLLADPDPVIVTSSLPNANQDIAYSQQIVATDNRVITGYTISAGELPTGLSLNSSTGLITGTPSGKDIIWGDVDPAVEGNFAKRLLQAAVDVDSDLKPFIKTRDPATGRIYGDLNLSGTPTDDADTQYVALNTADALLAGAYHLDPNDDGITAAQKAWIEDVVTPAFQAVSSSYPTYFTAYTASYDYTFTVRVADNTEGVTTADFTITKLPNSTQPVWVSTTLTPGEATEAYTQQLEVTEIGEVIFSITSGALPAGLTLSSTGLIAGTPTTEVVDLSVTITATNASNVSTNQIFTMTITAPLYGFESALFTDGGKGDEGDNRRFGPSLAQARAGIT